MTLAMTLKEAGVIAAIAALLVLVQSMDAADAERMARLERPQATAQAHGDVKQKR
jgi:hypothetical protein